MRFQPHNARGGTATITVQRANPGEPLNNGTNHRCGAKASIDLLPDKIRVTGRSPMLALPWSCTLCTFGDPCQTCAACASRANVANRYVLEASRLPTT